VIREEYRKKKEYNDSSFIHKEMDRHLVDKLAKYKTPRKYFIVTSLPRNHLGKVSEIV
jgi:acyl-coenzyme A synthetase/AMP-(fatty) acid ligase